MSALALNEEHGPNITKDQILGSLPKKSLSKYVTDELVDLINSESTDELRRTYKENFLSYTSVLTEGRYGLTQYTQAIKFVTHKLMGDNNTLAYSKVFPDRYQELINKGSTPREIASFASNYAKNQLVVKILEQTLVPTHILNAGLYQEAINTQAELMRNARSETVRQKAAESLIVNLKAPETAKIELDVNYNNDIVDDLRATTKALAKQQMEMIKNGHANAREIAHSEILAVKTEYSVDDVDEL